MMSYWLHTNVDQSATLADAENLVNNKGTTIPSKSFPRVNSIMFNLINTLNVNKTRKQN